MKENKNQEFKVDITRSFLKTVSAFSNYEGGTVLFGVDDDGKEVGIENAECKRIDIENMINDGISPQPDYTIEIDENKNIIILRVKKGENTPYFYKGKTYKRNDTATIEADSMELSRLVLEGRNISFEEIRAKRQELTFSVLEEFLKTRIGIENFNRDTLKTLNLYNDKDGYNNAAELVADENDFSGIDAAVFGENINTIKKRVTYEKESVLLQYKNIMELFRDNYVYEEISGDVRVKKELIPEVAFREVIANALIHRAWDINAHIKVSMFSDKIEVTSPGGLPAGISREEYLAGNLSVLRNAVLANILHRLGIVEIFGTGILRILNIYGNNIIQPKFEIYANSIKVTLPVINANPDLTEDQMTVYNVLSRTELKSISEIQKSIPFGKSKTLTVLKEMAGQGIVKVEGRGRGTKYHL